MSNHDRLKQKKASIVPEKVIQAHILSFLQFIGVYAWRNQSTGVYDPTRKVFRRPMSKHAIKGVSDILGILPDGRFLAIEVKSATGYASNEQKSFLEAIKANGGVSMIARSMPEVEQALRLECPQLFLK